MRILTVTLSALALGGCAVSIPPVEVTRFHLGTAIPAGTVRVETTPTLEGATYATAVGQALARIGFVAATGTAEPLYTANTSFSRLTREEAKKSPFSIGIGGGSFGSNVGVGLGASIPIGGKTRQIIVTRLSVQLFRKADATMIWQGKAETAAPSTAPASQPGLAAEKLANALFKDFPGASGQTVVVP
jgi:hypothetical protein